MTDAEDRLREMGEPSGTVRLDLRGWVREALGRLWRWVRG